MFLVLALAFAWVDGAAWSRRTGWDIVSYLDLGDAFLRGDWKAALSTYWSPLYGIIFAIARRFQSGITELDSLLIFNFSIFVLLALTFGYLAHMLRISLANVDAEHPYLISDNFYPLVLYTTFIYCTLTICGIRYKTPDMLSALVVISFFSIWQRSIAHPISYARCIFLGFLLGVSYLAKNSLVNWVIVVLATLFINRKVTQATTRQLIAIALMTGLTISAWAIPISLNAGHPTLTDTLTVARSWMWTLSPGLKQVHGQGASFKHPTRKFFTEPDFYEFATPFDVSYPPWYAPAYWFEGVPWKFSPPYYLTKLIEKIPQLILSYAGLLICGFGLVWCIARRSPFSSTRLRICLPLLIPSALGLGALAAFFEFEGRYLVPYTLPLFMGLFVCLKKNEHERREGAQLIVIKLMTAYMALASLLVFVFQFYFYSPMFANAVKSMVKADLPASPPFSAHDATVAALHDLGVFAGDRVARVSTLGHGEFYWARGGKFKIVAECVSPEQFFEASAERRRQLYAKLRELGVKAIIEDWSPDQEKYPVCTEPGWVNVQGTRNWILKL